MDNELSSESREGERENEWCRERAEVEFHPKSQLIISPTDKGSERRGDAPTRFDATGAVAELRGRAGRQVSSIIIST